MNTTRDAALALKEKEVDRLISEVKPVPPLESLIAEKGRAAAVIPLIA